MNGDEKTGEVVGKDAFLRIMASNRVEGLVRGPYNPILTIAQLEYFSKLEQALKHGGYVAGVDQIDQENVWVFRKCYGFDLPSQIEVLRYRKGAEWSAQELIHGTAFSDFRVLASDELPEDHFYVTYRGVSKGGKKGGERSVSHYVVNPKETIVSKILYNTVRNGRKALRKLEED